MLKCTQDLLAGSARPGTQLQAGCTVTPQQVSALVIMGVMRKRAQSRAGVELSHLTRCTASLWEEISIPDKCFSNFLINFNKIKTSLGKSATHTFS